MKRVRGLVRGLVRIAIRSSSAVGELVIAAVLGPKFAQRTRRFGLITTGTSVSAFAAGLFWRWLKPVIEVTSFLGLGQGHHIVSTLPLVILAPWLGFLFGGLLCVLDDTVDGGD